MPRLYHAVSFPLCYDVSLLLVQSFSLISYSLISPERGMAITQKWPKKQVRFRVVVYLIIFNCINEPAYKPALSLVCYRRESPGGRRGTVLRHRAGLRGLRLRYTLSSLTVDHGFVSRTRTAITFVSIRLCFLKATPRADSALYTTAWVCRASL